MKPETDVTGDEVLTKFMTAGLAASAVHIPVPVAAMTVVEYWQKVWSEPASGLDVTLIKTVSLQPLSDQYKVYVPDTVKPVTEVVADEAFRKLTTAGLPASAVHVPVPVAVNTVLEYWQMVWSAPALGLDVTWISTVSLHPFNDQYKV